VGNVIRQLFKQWFTGKDNESYEIMRALTALAVLAMLFYIGWRLIVQHEFDPLAAATGLAALLFGGGAGTAVKDAGGLGAKTKIDNGPDGTVMLGPEGGK
jgi:uncharacterized membrane protein